MSSTGLRFGLHQEKKVNTSHKHSNACANNGQPITKTALAVCIWLDFIDLNDYKNQDYSVKISNPVERTKINECEMHICN
jgi:hypothetical protein